ncbi:MAG: hypothetical protein HYY96_04215 [Candidatus Tectomicrobia bacterium]|nr:hypothetical protein [Candidatus Tectomicrobia bacterium]
MYECIEALKGKQIEVGLPNQTLHGVLADVVAEDPAFLLLQEENQQTVLVNLRHVVTLRTVGSLDPSWQRGGYY